jgi:hypothetical protein
MRKAKVGDIVRVTECHYGASSDSKNLIAEGEVRWAVVEKVYDDITDCMVHWIGEDLRVGLSRGAGDKWTVFTEDTVPDEYWAEVAKCALLGETS